jgi:poly(A) polymerase
MEICNITPSKLVGVLKDEITNAILDGVIPHDHDAAKEYLMRIKDEVMRNFAAISHTRQ